MYVIIVTAICLSTSSHMELINEYDMWKKYFLLIAHTSTLLTVEGFLLGVVVIITGLSFIIQHALNQLGCVTMKGLHDVW